MFLGNYLISILSPLNLCPIFLSCALSDLLSWSTPVSGFLTTHSPSPPPAAWLSHQAHYTEMPWSKWPCFSFLSPEPVPDMLNLITSTSKQPLPLLLWPCITSANHEYVSGLHWLSILLPLLSLGWQRAKGLHATPVTAVVSDSLQPQGP